MMTDDEYKFWNKIPKRNRMAYLRNSTFGKDIYSTLILFRGMSLVFIAFLFVSLLTRLTICWYTTFIVVGLYISIILITLHEKDQINCMMRTYEIIQAIKAKSG